MEQSCPCRLEDMFIGSAIAGLRYRRNPGGYYRKNPAKMTGFAGHAEAAKLPSCGSLTAVNGQAAEEPWFTRGPTPEALAAPKAATAPLDLSDEVGFGLGGGKRVQGKGLGRKSTKCERGCDGGQRQEAFHEQKLRVLISFLKHRRVDK
jgi:hypothetical protein